MRRPRSPEPCRCRTALVRGDEGRIKEDDADVPAPDGPYAYFSRHREGGQHPLICREPRGGGATETILDGDALAAGKPFFRIGATAHSPDHRLLAWSADDSGTELFTVHVRDIARQVDLPDLVTETTGGIVWSQDAQRLLLRPASIATIVPSACIAIASAPAPADDDASRRRRGQRIVRVALQAAVRPLCRGLAARPRDIGELADRSCRRRREARAGRAARSLDPLRCRASPDARRRAGPVHSHQCRRRRGFQDRLDAARREAAATIGAMSFPIAPASTSCALRCFAGWLIRLEREDGLARIVVRRLADGEEHTIAFDEEAYSLGFDAGYEFDTDTLRFSYSSMTTPSEIWDYDLAARTRRLRKRQEIPSGHDPSAYVTRRVLAPSFDGETVPVSLLYRKETPLDGTAPALVYGYGAYGISIPAAFAPNRLSLADRGFVVAIAHVRGGTEKGWRWYREGKLAKKQNTFSDFIAVDRISHRAEIRLAAQGRRPRRLRRRHADRRRRQCAARPVRRAHRRGPVRRRAQHHARRHLAVDAAGMAGMGQSHHRRRGLRRHPQLFALRQCARPGLSGDAGAGRAHRSARDLLGARQVGGAAAPAQDHGQHARAAHQSRCRPWRRGRAIRPAQGGRARPTPSRSRR